MKWNWFQAIMSPSTCEGIWIYEKKKKRKETSVSKGNVSSVVRDGFFKPEVEYIKHLIWALLSNGSFFQHTDGKQEHLKKLLKNLHAWNLFKKHPYFREVENNE